MQGLNVLFITFPMLIPYTFFRSGYKTLDSLRATIFKL